MERINNFLLNIIIELVILCCIILWAAMACTIIIPIIWKWFIGDFFDIKSELENIRSFKFKY